MKQGFTLLSAFLITVTSWAKPAHDSIAIVPKPVSITQHSGHYTLPKTVRIVTPKGKDLRQSADLLKKRLTTAADVDVKLKHKSKKGSINLKLLDSPDDELGDEGYKLSVTDKNIELRANKSAGLFYGVQSLLQLFPSAIESDGAVSDVKWEVPNVEITDYPRLKWRGLMFDVVRHFFTKDEVKRFIDDMVKYKYNVLHLHLADDQGWRIEIDGYPKLTEESAWRPERVGYFGTFSAPDDDEPRDYGGYYTQDDIKELVAYAKDRHVDIMPEIDVPGHSLAAVSAYPELSCNPDLAKDYEPDIGEPFIDWAHNKSRIDNNLCPTKDKVYEFLDTVIGQLSDLFPFEYLDMGGDETMYNFWADVDSVKELMKKEDMDSLPEVQGYFTHRVEEIVESHDKRMVGWDEILEGGVSPNATVMSWRGMEGGIQAAKMGHDVIMTPTDYAYLDYMQGDSIIEPRVYGKLTLKKSYQFDPVPDEVDSKYILGGQGNLWTEQLIKFRDVQYMLWPRAMAVSEALWSPQSKRDWNDFFGRVEQQFKRLDAANTKYAPSVYDPDFRASRDENGDLKIKLVTEPNDLDVYYSFDNSFPDQYYPKYKEPLSIPKEAVTLKVVTYQGDEKVGRIIAMPIEELEERADKE